MASRPPRIVITGMGALSCLGNNAKDTWAGMREGRSGITPIDLEEFKRWDGQWDVTFAGQVRNWDPAATMDFREAKRVDRFTQLGICAAIEAVAHSGIDFTKEIDERCGTIFGSGIGGIQTIEEGKGVLDAKGPRRINVFTVPRLMPNAVAGGVSIRFGLRGPASTHATACASSGHALGDAVHTMRRGEADVMVVGGAEAAVSPVCISAFSVMKAL
ncbi:MAG: beta-ketoacyl synthase N-terminal-like domain-containing protein, partial [Phycisphaerales bacterium]|nr:beta-ketoacyl synthase N-terminal-like domain-containing protein [Phycisphaerales bacterium]